MRAVVLVGTGSYDKLQVQERPDPEVGAGQVRIDVRAAGVNFAEHMARQGLYADAPPTPCVLGYEVAGRIDEALTPGRNERGFHGCCPSHSGRKPERLQA